MVTTTAPVSRKPSGPLVDDLVVAAVSEGLLTLEQVADLHDQLAACETEQQLEVLVAGGYLTADELSGLIERLTAQSLYAATAELPAPSLDAEMITQLLDSGPVDMVGDFELGDLIGHGGFGEVYRARQRGVERDVAVKLLHAVKGRKHQAVERMQAEVRLLGQLDHPNLVKVIAFGVDGGRTWFAMELLDGCSLRDVIERGERMEVRRVVRLAAQTARGLGAAHRCGIVHRDVKPANIQVVPSPEGERAVVLDFGLARDLQDPRLTRPGIAIGTPSYMSPEQSADESVGATADVYSLCTAIFELVSGELPFADPDVQVVLNRKLEEPPPWLGDRVSVDGDLEAVVDKGLATDPGERYADGDELAADLERWLAGEPVLAVAPSRWRREWARWRRRPQLTLAMLGMLICAGLAAGFYLRGQRAVADSREQRALLERERQVRGEVAEQGRALQLEERFRLQRQLLDSELSAAEGALEPGPAMDPAGALRRLDALRERLSALAEGPLVAEIEPRLNVASGLAVGLTGDGGRRLQAMGWLTAHTRGPLAVRAALGRALLRLAGQGLPHVVLRPASGSAALRDQIEINAFPSPGAPARDGARAVELRLALHELTIARQRYARLDIERVRVLLWLREAGRAKRVFDELPLGNWRRPGRWPDYFRALQAGLHLAHARGDHAGFRALLDAGTAAWRDSGARTSYDDFAYVACAGTILLTSRAVAAAPEVRAPALARARTLLAELRQRATHLHRRFPELRWFAGLIALIDGDARAAVRERYLRPAVQAGYRPLRDPRFEREPALRWLLSDEELWR